MEFQLKNQLHVYIVVGSGGADKAVFVARVFDKRKVKHKLISFLGVHEKKRRTDFVVPSVLRTSIRKRINHRTNHKRS
jgi:hypothetical protein